MGPSVKSVSSMLDSIAKEKKWGKKNVWKFVPLRADISVTSDNSLNR